MVDRCRASSSSRSGWSSPGQARRRWRGGFGRATRPVVGRVDSRAVLLDLRTIDPADDIVLGQALARALTAPVERGREDRVTVVIGTAGHIDHGKTTLLRALTGIDADRLPEEQRRGMTIDVGYAHLTLPDGTELDFVDVPGHDRLVGNMLVGAGEIDAAMLVVAADDGPRAQTMEHLALLDALGISHGVAVVTKADVAGPTRTAEVVADVERLLSGTTLAGSPVLAVSSIDGDGVEALRAALVDLRDRVLESTPHVPETRIAPRDRPGLLGQGPRRRCHRNAPWPAAGAWRHAPARPGRPIRPCARDPGPRRRRRRGPARAHGTQRSRHRGR